MSPAKRVLLLMTPSTYRASDFLHAARGAGLAVVVGTSRPQVLADAAPAANLTLPFDDDAEALRLVLAYAATEPLDAVLGVDDEGVLLAARLAARLGLRNSSPSSVAATRDKAAMRRTLADAGLRGPRFVVWDGSGDPRSLASAVRYPCVAKPLSLSASRGVIRANDPDELLLAIARIERLLDDPEVSARSRGLGGRRILIEDFVPGDEVALEGLLRSGAFTPLALFDKPDPLDGPYFEETLLVTPSRKPQALQRRIVEEAARGARALGLTEGPIHAELRVRGDAVTILEIAARSIGGLCSRALRFGTGMSLEEVILRNAAELPIPSLDRESRAAGVMMIPIPGAGRLGRVTGIEAARAVGGIEEVTLAIHAGQAVVPLPEGNRYLGFIVARGPSAEVVEADLRKAHSLLEIEILPPASVSD